MALAVVFSRRQDDPLLFENVWTPLDAEACQSFSTFAVAAAAAIELHDHSFTIVELRLLPALRDDGEPDAADATAIIRLSTVDPDELSELLARELSCSARGGGPRVVEVQIDPPLLPAGVLRPPVLEAALAGLTDEQRIAAAARGDFPEDAGAGDSGGFEDTEGSDGFEDNSGRFFSAESLMASARLSFWRVDLCQRLGLALSAEDEEDQDALSDESDFLIGGMEWKIRKIDISESREFARMFCVAINFVEEAEVEGNWKDDPRETTEPVVLPDTLSHISWPSPSGDAAPQGPGAAIESFEEEEAEATRIIAADVDAGYSLEYGGGEAAEKRGAARCTVSVIVFDQRRIPWGATCELCAVASNITAIHRHLSGGAGFAAGIEVPPLPRADRLVIAICCDLLDVRSAMGRRFQEGGGANLYCLASYFAQDRAFGSGDAILGNVDKAEPLMRQALEVQEASLGATHPDTLTTVGNLASLLRAHGKLDEAESLMKRALEGRESTLGPTHPSTMFVMRDLASLLQEQGKLDEAEVLMRRALEWFEVTLGALHPDTLTAAGNLASLLRAQEPTAAATAPQPLANVFNSPCRANLEAWRKWCSMVSPHARVETGSLAADVLEPGPRSKLHSDQARRLMARLLKRNAPVTITFRHSAGRTSADCLHVACVVALDHNGFVTIVDSHTGGGTCEDSRRVTTRPVNRAGAFVVSWHRFYYSWAQAFGEWFQIVPILPGLDDFDAHLWHGMQRLSPRPEADPDRMSDQY